MSFTHQINKISSRVLSWTPSLTLSTKIDRLLGTLLRKFLLLSGLVSWRNNFTYSDVNLRTACFIKEARKEGWKFEGLKSPLGFTGHFRAKKDDKKIVFEGLPLTEISNKYRSGFVDNKGKLKKALNKNNFPAAPGKSFWFWQKRRMLNYGQKLGYPLVVKPNWGSSSEGVTTNIANRPQLKKAINKASCYAPVSVVEKYITKAFVHRATVIDYKSVACVKQVPANVVGDGVSTIRELIERKNNDEERGEWGQGDSTLYKIVSDKNTTALLSARGLNSRSIPLAHEIVYLQRDPFLKLGGDLVEVTSQVHPDNLQLFYSLAKFFDVKLVGIDFICRDISISWHKQSCAILELNSLPCIELHHFPYAGAPQNVARSLVETLSKYY